MKVSSVSFSLLLGGFIEAVILAPPGFAQPGCPTALQINTPQPGAILASQQVASISAALTPSFSRIGSNAVTLSVQITAQDSAGAQYGIASGDDRTFANPDNLEGQWNLNTVASGTATIFVKVQVIQRAGPCSTLQASVSVTINRAPTLTDLNLACAATQGGTQVTITPVTQDPEGDALVRFLWYPGDGTPVTEIPGSSPFTHIYVSGQPVILWVVGFDARGGMFLEARNLDSANCAFLQAGGAANQCGCDRITILQGANMTSQLYCLPAGHQFLARPDRFPCVQDRNAPANACNRGETPVRCRLGVLDAATNVQNERILGWSFEITANLNARSNAPAACEQGQLTRGTLRFQEARGQLMTAQNPVQRREPRAGLFFFPGGSFERLAGNNTRVPPFDFPDRMGNVLGQPTTFVRFGADDYAAANELTQLRDANGVRNWLDIPFSTFVNTDQLQSNQRMFVSFVDGNLGTCWCQFAEEQQWTPGAGRRAIGGGAAPNQLRVIAGNNCNIQ